MIKKYTSSQKGVTLIELLAAVSISAIALTLIYSIFATGISLFQKGEINNLLRDDADYIATSVMNELYANSPESVEGYSDYKGITMTRAGQKDIKEGGSGEVIDQPEKDTKIQIYFKENSADKKYLKLYIKKGVSGTPYEIETPTALIGKDSTITVQKANDSSNSGTIKLKLYLYSEKGIKGSVLRNKPMEFRSSFGY